MFYFVKTPGWLKRIYDSYVWSIDSEEKKIYLTFDDGPHPVVTPYVLDQLKQYHARATFFCVGQNVEDHPGIYQQILSAGHKTGNHTYNHLNGWRTDNSLFMQDIAKATDFIQSNLFRPPYGKITSFQWKNLQSVMKVNDPKVIMWDVLSADFDTSCTPVQCLANVVLSTVPGSIVIFHDSEKAFPRLEYTLPRVLKYYSELGYSFDSL